MESACRAFCAALSMPDSQAKPQARYVPVGNFVESLDMLVGMYISSDAVALFQTSHTLGSILINKAITNTLPSWSTAAAT
eukprot:scaffold217580_cov18-Prasinocladus_malaysianus.AAC.1